LRCAGGTLAELEALLVRVAAAPWSPGLRDNLVDTIAADI
jgi:hypothetical protein